MHHIEMERFCHESFLSPLAATAALLPYVGRPSVSRHPSQPSAREITNTRQPKRPSPEQRKDAFAAFASIASAAASELENVKVVAGPMDADDDAVVLSRAINLLLGAAATCESQPNGHDVGQAIWKQASPWFTKLLTDVLAYALSADISDQGTEIEEDADSQEESAAFKVDLLGPPLRKLCLLMPAQGVAALSTVLRSATADHVRDLILRGDNQTRALGPSVRWCAEVLMPWVARLLIGPEDLERLALAVGGSADSDSSVGGSDGHDQDLLDAIAALRASGLLPSPLHAWPHPHLSATCTAHPDYDDGSGGAGLGGCAAEVDHSASTSDRAGFSDGVSTPLSLSASSLAARLRLLHHCDRLIFNHVHSCVALARTEKSFDLIRDYPDSLPALCDLRDALRVAGEGARATLVSSLTVALKTRLLHPGVQTLSILLVFLSTIRCIRIVVDDGGVLLSLIADPIQAYLRTRPDTIRCIVSSLTEDTESELYQELSAASSGAKNGLIEARGGESEDVDALHIEAEGTDIDGGVVGGGAWSGGDESSFVGALQQAAARLRPQADEADADESDGGDDGPSMTVRYLYRILGPMQQHGLPTNHFARGDALYRSSMGAAASSGGGSGGGVYASMGTSGSGGGSGSLPARTPGLWNPASVEVDATRDGVVGRQYGTDSSLLSILVDIYGGKDMFVRLVRRTPAAEHDGCFFHATSVIHSSTLHSPSFLRSCIKPYPLSHPPRSEYRSMLSERLLSKPPHDYDTSNEERTVELLKLRFGDEAMVSTETMLRDVLDSKRVSAAIGAQLAKKGACINVAVAPHLPSDTEDPSLQDVTPGESIISASLTSSSAPGAATAAPVDTMILSHHYWPSLPREKPVIAQPLQDLFTLLSSEYLEVKKPREMHLVTSLGGVQCELQLPGEDEPREVSGTPQQISVLLHIAGRRSIGLTDLSSLMCLTSTGAALRLVAHWTAKGILAVDRQGGGDATVWVASCMPRAAGDASNGDANTAGGGASAGHEDDGGALGLNTSAGGGASGGDDPEAVMMWQSYVIGMLSNLGHMPLDRIHNTLKMFASMGDYPCKYIDAV